jgi:2-keto-4-pentenoate hydratase/2-oxohepta-3-ene-1,7-dioic acid hydratase in catechol pathway
MQLLSQFFNQIHFQDKSFMTTINAMPSFNRLLRFRDRNGNIYYGEAPSTALTGEDLVGLRIKPYLGNPLECDAPLPFSEEETTVAEVLSPLSETPIIYGIGLNYRKHAEEAGVSRSIMLPKLCFLC